MVYDCLLSFKLTNLLVELCWYKIQCWFF